MSEDLKKQIKEAVARNLRDFGYPDASADNVLAGGILTKFATRQIEDFADEHPGKTDVQTACRELLEEAEKAA